MEIKISNKKYSVTIDNESDINEMMDGKEYFDKACKRIDNERRQLTLF